MALGPEAQVGPALGGGGCKAQRGRSVQRQSTLVEHRVQRAFGHHHDHRRGCVGKSGGIEEGGFAPAKRAMHEKHCITLVAVRREEDGFACAQQRIVAVAEARAHGGDGVFGAVDHGLGGGGWRRGGGAG